MAAQWREFCDERPKTFEELKVHSSLPTWNFSLRPPADVAELANNGRTAAQLAQQQAMANAVHVGQPRTITSSVADGDEGRADRDARTADAAMRGMRTALVQNEWIMHKAKYDCCDFALNTGPTSCGGCHIPLLLGQIHGSVGELDTTDPDTRVEIKCWKPKDGCYAGDWCKWLVDGGKRSQLIATIAVGVIVVQEVHFTTKKPKNWWLASAGDSEKEPGADARAVELGCVRRKRSRGHALHASTYNSTSGSTSGRSCGPGWVGEPCAALARAACRALIPPPFFFVTFTKIAHFPKTMH